jgi:DNA-binding MarR family transcriptional regulator
MDGSRRPAGELAATAGVTAATASEHLAVLVDAGLVRCEPRGRQRFYVLAGASVAAALEHLGRLCPPAPTATYRQTRDARELAAARFCYDHLAGRLGVELLDAMRRAGWLHPDDPDDPDAEPTGITPRGRVELMARGIPLDDVAGRGRRLVRVCPDWTERRSHLAGALGAAVAARVVEEGWVRRRAHGRGLDVTPVGAAELGRTWGASVRPTTLAGRAG